MDPYTGPWNRKARQMIRMAVGVPLGKSSSSRRQVPELSPQNRLLTLVKIRRQLVHRNVGYSLLGTV